MPFKSIIAEVAETPHQELERENVDASRLVAEGRSWADLEAALDYAQTAYERGDMTQEEGEALAIKVAQKARELPTTPTPKWLVIRSRLLDGEQILLVLHKRYLREARQAHPDKVIYLPHEVDHLHRRCKAQPDREIVRKTHLVKKEFDGWIEPPYGAR